MEIKNDLIKYTNNTKGSFYVEESENIYYVFFNDESIDPENAIKINEEEDQVTIYSTSTHTFNNGLGFMISICSTPDKECADMICESLNLLKSK